MSISTLINHLIHVHQIPATSVPGTDVHPMSVVELELVHLHDDEHDREEYGRMTHPHTRYQF